MNSTKGLTLLININWDRLFYLAAIVFLLGASAWIGTLTMAIESTMGHSI
ncbi:MAG: hypothetical protein JKX69_06795 [Rhodobacteraceae bacterium]|nr:hypothetical protein [Paracoccaceae bacterium]